jgi:hypothetical protein
MSARSPNAKGHPRGVVMSLYKLTLGKMVIKYSYVVV